jgi:DNA-directed RNA polymerase I subunit RPA2
MPSIVPSASSSTQSSASKSKTSKAVKKHTKTSQEWNHEFDTIRREELFRHPPTDRTAYPLLKNAVAPHVDSFNALFEEDGLIAHALKDIGTKIYLDGNDRDGPVGKNRLQVRIKEVFLEKSKLPDVNKFTSLYNRKILPAECRERHGTYRGRLSATVEYRINDEAPKEWLQNLGLLPIMLMVSLIFYPAVPVLTG